MNQKKTAMKTKLLLLLTCILFAFKSNAQSVGDTFTVNYIEYTVTSDLGSLKVSVTSYTGGSFDIDIPSTVTHEGDVYYVTAIGDSAFENNLIERVTFGDYITTIGAYAFYGNYMTTLTIPASVTSIGDYAFHRGYLSSVTSLSENPATLPSNVLSGINNIHLHIPEGSEQNYIDAGWTGFQTVNLRFTLDGVVYEINEAGSNEVTVVDYVGTDDEVIIPERVTDNGGVIYLVTEIGDLAFYENGLTSITIPPSITSIGEGAFLYNELEDFTIPESVTSMGESAFLGNPYLTEVTSESENPAYLPNNAFDNKKGITLNIPAGTSQDYLDQNWTGFGLVIEDTTLTITEVDLSNQLAIITNTNTLTIVSNTLEIKQVEIYAVTGTKVAFGTSNQIAIHHLNTGIYIAKIYTNNAMTTKKFIKR